MRYFCQLSYLGTNYHGWQIQQNAHTIQGEIESALKKILGAKTDITGSGRTDAGVHASQQFFHFETTNPIDIEKVVYKLNAVLPKDIVIESIRSVHPDAHARFDAIKRSYIYRINSKKDPFKIGLVYTYYKSLNVDLMNKAAERFLGERDFESFSKVKTEVNNFLCNVFEAKWVENKGELQFHISANRFLRGMVRAIVGTLLLVGEERLSSDDIEKIILAKDRKKAGRAVPPEGLYLSSVEYSDKIYSS